MYKTQINSHGNLNDLKQTQVTDFTSESRKELTSTQQFNTDFYETDDSKTHSKSSTGNLKHKKGLINVSP